MTTGVTPLGRLRATIRAYLELARVSNLPTVWSNVMVGCAIGAVAGGRVYPIKLLWLGVAMSLLYTAGMALNDAVDADADRLEKPDRPIPSGRVPRRAAYALGVLGLAAGVAIAWDFGRAAGGLALVLAGAIVGYDALHKRFPPAALLMGACRALVYLVAAVAGARTVDARLAGVLAVTLALYIVLLTVAAQVETREALGGRRLLPPLLPFVALWPLAWRALWPPAGALPDAGPLAALLPRAWLASWWPTAAAAAVALAWLGWSSRHALARPARMRPAVLGWLSGICLIDAAYLAALGRPGMALAAAGLFVLTALGHRVILGT